MGWHRFPEGGSGVLDKAGGWCHVRRSASNSADTSAEVSGEKRVEPREGRNRRSRQTSLFSRGIPKLLTLCSFDTKIRGWDPYLLNKKIQQPCTTMRRIHYEEGYPLPPRAVSPWHLILGSRSTVRRDCMHHNLDSYFCIRKLQTFVPFPSFRFFRIAPQSRGAEKNLVPAKVIKEERNTISISEIVLLTVIRIFLPTEGFSSVIVQKFRKLKAQ